MMKTFENVHFKWTFRSYQQRVLDNADNFISDSKIHIVAAPGSGKTILGLELIRRLNAPTIILSPTTTIRHQWGERFKDAFIDENENIDDYFSYDLNEITLINSITYQALYSAMNKLLVESEDETVDYSNIDLFKLVVSSGIKTICLDEAHHLQNEWQKALEKFIAGLDKDIKVISLTATPPYDAKGSEWNRYSAVNGDIDDEIFVPELVKENTLCPHQDYIFFSYPTKEEFRRLNDQKNKIPKALCDLKETNIIEVSLKRIVDLYYKESPIIYENYSSVVGFLILAKSLGNEIDKKMFKKLTSSIIVPSYTNAYAERGLQFIIDDENILSKEEKTSLITLLKHYGLIDKKKVDFDFNEKLKKSIISSVSKLSSIVTITQNEIESLKKNLRMLILTDYIKKEALNSIGKEEKINNISVVSIFEELRRNIDVPLGVLSGSIVILPLSLEDKLVNTYNVNHDLFKVTKINNTNYGVYSFKGRNKEKVDIVSNLFDKGEVQVLIGTQALLGEGWDSPCINSLILASYVGSFMLSNQMRGRAIRTYKSNPHKTSNIWHLVTLEPDYKYEDNLIEKATLFLGEDKNEISSCDYDTLCRRFASFVGPNYDTGEIENGIERITIIKPPFNEDGFKKINEQMLERAKQRDKLESSWKEATKNHSKIHSEVDVPKVKYPQDFTYLNVLTVGLLGVFELIAIFFSFYLPLGIGRKGNEALYIILSLILFIASTLTVSLFSYRILNRFTPKNMFTSLAKALVGALKERGLISNGAYLKVIASKDSIFINFTLQNATIHEQNIFNNAICEMLSPIETPKYIVVKQLAFGSKYRYSFAVPSVIAKRDGVDAFRHHLNKYIGGTSIVYTYNDLGRRTMIKCRNQSFITKNHNQIYKKQRINRFEK